MESDHESERDGQDGGKLNGQDDSGYQNDLFFRIFGVRQLFISSSLKIIKEYFRSLAGIA